MELKRAIHIDFHTMPGIYDFGHDFDAVEFAETLEKAHVTIINMFFQCNIGYVYYPTKIGVPYPNMKGDMFGDVVRECHKRNIKIVGYTNTSLNHTQALLHPEWCRIDESGHINNMERGSHFFRTMCYNNPGYRAYLSSLIKEVFEKYDIDGIFADCMNPNPYCHCPKCTADMKRLGLDIHNENHWRYLAYKSFYEFARMIRDAVPEGKLCQQTGVPFDDPKVMDVSSHGEVECLPSGSWGYDFFGTQVAYMRKFRDPILYMTGRFQSSWADFGGYKGKISLENDCFEALQNGAQVSIGDHMHPARNINRAMYKDIGEIFERVMEYEPWIDNTKYLAEVAILNDETYIGKEEMRGGLGRNVSVRGAGRMLQELKYDFDVINENLDFAPYKLIIVPDEIYLSEHLEKKLEAFVESGGKVLSSGWAGVRDGAFPMPAWQFIQVDGKEETEDSYYTLPEDEMVRSMYAGGILMHAEDGQGQHIPPYFERGWNGEHYNAYLPPEKPSGHCVVAQRGNVCHISFQIFRAYFMKAAVFHKKLVASILEELLPNPQVKCRNIPSTARVTLTGAEDYNLLHIKTSYPEKRGDKMCIIEEHVVLPAGREVYVRGEYRDVYRLPEKTPVDFTVEDGYTKVILPEICGYDMFLLEK